MRVMGILLPSILGQVIRSARFASMAFESMSFYDLYVQATVVNRCNFTPTHTYMARYFVNECLSLR